MREVSEAEYEEFSRSADPGFPGLEEEERILSGLSTLRIFWASGWVERRLVGLEEGGELRAVGRLLRVRVPFHQRGVWRVRERAELQGLRGDPGAVARLALRAEREAGLPLGVSSSRPEVWGALRRVGLLVYSRSATMEWPGEVPIEGNPEVEVSEGAPRSALREIMRESWGFFIPPSPVHLVLVARLRGVPVGLCYLNPETGNLDFGVHVRRRFWRMRVGTSLVRAALGECRRRGLAMTVVRVVPITRVRESDERALRFYSAVGAVLREEVRGFRRKRRGVSEAVPLPGWLYRAGDRGGGGQEGGAGQEREPRFHPV